jgi:uncharacterized cupredoxin-like copper-binding protein
MKANAFRRNAVILGSAVAVTVGGSVAAFAAGHAGHPNATTAHHKTLHVVESDYHIALSTHSGKPGTYRIVDVNHSDTKHGLVFNGPGEHEKFLGFVKPHKTLTATIRLHKGKYDIFCPVPGHKMLGMNTHLKIS